MVGCGCGYSVCTHYFVGREMAKSRLCPTIIVMPKASVSGINELESTSRRGHAVSTLHLVASLGSFMFCFCFFSCQTVGASPHSRAHKSLTLPQVYMHMACCWKWLDAPNY